VAALGGILSVVGFIVMLVGAIMFLIAAFREHILWGLGTLFVPFVGLIFLIMHWDVAKKPFLIQLLGIPFVVIGALLAGGGGAA
jgi:hypothetical protein